ncbi:ribokinase [Pullulanibacillus sp. KACC 23026]|uniref:ribokinase n=1 Tax=Pullulanibacillus sp. KACC 23026 TaxID=3028315 RepID=UPI0023B07517|nr:ribokinase [Pullulanibacillus sp. KACC 23026]WEG13327.1 ribokinase [Pullulanibacillus sp. KACC 23026]
MKKTVVIGSINMDLVNKVHAHPLPGETILGLNLEYSPGGKGANQAVATARAGSDVTMLGAVGNDEFSRRLLENLSRNHVNTSFVKTTDGPTSLAIITVDDRGENSIIVTPGANQTFSEHDLIQTFDEKAFEDVHSIILQNEIPLTTTLKAIEMANRKGIQVIFNPAPISNIGLEHLEQVDVVILNETEAQTLTGMDLVYDFNKENVQEAFRMLLRSGPKAVIITLGEHGSIYGTYQTVEGGQNEDPSFLLCQDGLTLIKEDAFKVKTVDTTAAGDTFVGAFSTMYETPSDAKEALRFATAASALAVTKEGAQESTPYKDEILKFLSEQQR